VAAGDLDAFVALVQDAHIRRYMMDGQILPPSWAAAKIAESAALFDRVGVGLWIVHERETGALVGFCGFLVLPDVHDAPELVYALRAPFTGRGSVAEARALRAFGEILASVDAVNAASVRVLEKLGFQRTEIRPGAFGDMLLFGLTVELPVGDSS
jgi:ribosomal-protein-alanine N-acetyltransferase